MSRPIRIALISAGSFAALALLVVTAALIVAQSGWLREKLRTAIIERAEIATGASPMRG